MIDIVHDLLSNLRFVSSISIVWLAVAWVTRRETTVPAKIGAITHGILAFSPILAISAYGTTPEMLVVTIHGSFALAHGILLFFAPTKGRGKRNA